MLISMLAACATVPPGRPANRPYQTHAFTLHLAHAHHFFKLAVCAAVPPGRPANRPVQTRAFTLLMLIIFVNVLCVQLFHKAGLPAGLINLVTGKGSEIGDFLTQHPSVNCISFTGGSTGGRRACLLVTNLSLFWRVLPPPRRPAYGAPADGAGQQGCVHHFLLKSDLVRHVPSLSFAGIAISKKASMVPLQMELGGKDVCIVCSDADLTLAAKHILKGGFSYSGQRCTAVKLVLADKKVGLCCKCGN
eukprot:1158216-Pelagomonas_calceolata.AAC.5